MGEGSWLRGWFITTPRGGEERGRKASLKPSNPWAGPFSDGALRSSFQAGDRAEASPGLECSPILERDWSGATGLVIGHLDSRH